LTPSNQVSTPQLSDEAELGEGDQDDPLDKFLPPPPKAKCSEELQVSSVKMVLNDFDV